MGVGYKKKLRGVASRKRASFIFVSAEGKNKTETNYLRGFSNRNFVFRFVSSGKTDPVKCRRSWSERWKRTDSTDSLAIFNNNDEVVDELKKYLPDYAKSLVDMKANLSDKTSTAIKNAKRLRKWNLNYHRKEHTVEFQPGTEVYIIVEELLKSAKCE